jgi:Spy/CpxP family protein refolding chaperone
MINDKSMKLKLWMLALVIFFLGGISGAAVHALYKVKTTSLSPQPPRQGMMEKMKQDLSLTDEQTTQIKTILEDSRKEFRRVVKEECPSIGKIRENTSQRIRAILTPEQQQKFDEIRKQRETMHKDKEAK